MARVVDARPPRPSYSRPGHAGFEAALDDRASFLVVSRDLPTDDSLSQPHHENLTGTRGAYKCYNTTKAKVAGWEPQVAPRD